LIGGAIGYGEATVKFGMEREKRGNKKELWKLRFVGLY
jgi:hypothetical protein